MRWTLATSALFAAFTLVACKSEPPPVNDMMAVAEVPTGHVDYAAAESPRPQWTGSWTAAPQSSWPKERQTWVFKVRSMDTTGRIINRPGVPVRIRARYFGPKGEVPDAGSIVEVVADDAVASSTSDDVVYGTTKADGTIAVDVVLRAPGDGGRYKVDEVELAADEFKVDKDGPSLTLVASIVKVVPGG